MAEAEPKTKTKTEYLRRAHWAKAVGDDVELVDSITAAVEVTAEDGTIPVLNAAERALLAEAYHGIVSPLRFAMSQLAKLEKGTKKGAERNQLREYRAEMAEKLWKRCDDLVHLVQDKIFKKLSNRDEEVFYLKMVGDYYRYMTEASSGDAEKDCIHESLKAYKQAWKLAKANLAPTETLRLGLVLNYSVFYQDMLDATEVACDLIEEALKDIPKKDYKKLDIEGDEIFRKLKFNLDLWSAATEDVNNNSNSEVEVTERSKPKSKTKK